jgi:dGTPase
MYNGDKTIDTLPTNNQNTKIFKDWLIKYSETPYKKEENQHEVLYDLRNQKDYKQAIIDFIAGMTDRYAIKTYNLFLQS